MFDNDSGVNDSSTYDEDINDDTEFYRYDTIYWDLITRVDNVAKYTILTLTLVTFSIGVTSWRIIRKFRLYRNYVYLNAILTNFLQIIVNILIPYTMGSIKNAWFHRFFFCLNVYLSSVKSHWLLLICHLFYADFVKVFDVHIQRRYLKSTLFAWGVSFVTTTIFMFVLYYFLYYSSDMTIVNRSVSLIVVLTRGSSILALTANCCLYILIVRSVCRNFNTSSHTASNTWRRLYISTLIFVLSDIMMLSEYVASFFRSINFTTAFLLLETLLPNFSAFVLSVFFVVVKSNRKIWREFFILKFKQRSSSATLKNKDIKMRTKINCEPADSHPEVLEV